MLACDLVFAEDHGKQGVRFVRVFHLRLDASAGNVRQRGQTEAPQIFRQAHGLEAAVRIRGRDINIGALCFREFNSLRFHQQPQTLNAEAEPASRGGGAAELFHEPVVSAAAAYRALRADRVGYEFKHGPRVVIQSAHDPRVDRERDVHCAQIPLHALEMPVAVLTQVVEHLRRVFGHLAAFGILAVQNAHRVALQPVPAGIAKSIDVFGEIGFQRGLIVLAAIPTADGVDLQPDILQLEGIEKVRSQRYDFRVLRR